MITTGMQEFLYVLVCLSTKLPSCRSRLGANRAHVWASKKEKVLTGPAGQPLLKDPDNEWTPHHAAVNHKTFLQH